ncbi:MAG: DJ-1/PfpI family protein [Hyphomonadaceae bacterium]|nr:DJ-1/PfpI family protein [Hyphomonadaceae bacterium]
MSDRRSLLRWLTAAPAGLALANLATGVAGAQQSAARNTAPQTVQDAVIPNLVGSEQIAMLLYPGFTALDLVGPHFFFGCLAGARVHLVSTQETLEPVVSDLMLAVQPTIRLSDVSDALDVVFVPGGSAGTLAAMQHQPTLEFLRTRGRAARVKTSVCTGSFVLAAAGLLQGKRATSHWLARESLAAFGAIPIDERVVRDGDTITGAGVSAGLDMGVAVVEALRGRPYAQALMLQAEYAPQPPVVGGRPENTDPAITQMLRGRSQFRANAEAIAAGRQ